MGDNMANYSYARPGYVQFTSKTSHSAGNDYGQHEAYAASVSSALSTQLPVVDEDDSIFEDCIDSSFLISQSTPFAEAEKEATSQLGPITGTSTATHDVHTLTECQQGPCASAPGGLPQHGFQYTPGYGHHHYGTDRGLATITWSSEPYIGDEQLDPRLRTPPNRRTRNYEHSIDSEQLTTPSLTSGNTYICHCHGRSFGRNSELQRHLRQQNELPGYPCPYPDCDRSFYDEKDLKRHLRVKTHNNSRMFLCLHPKCVYATEGFSRRDNLKRHMKKQHGIEHA